MLEEPSKTKTRSKPLLALTSIFLARASTPLGKVWLQVELSSVHVNSMTVSKKFVLIRNAVSFSPLYLACCSSVGKKVVPVSNNLHQFTYKLNIVRNKWVSTGIRQRAFCPIFPVSFAPSLSTDISCLAYFPPQIIGHTHTNTFRPESLSIYCKLHITVSNQIVSHPLRRRQEENCMSPKVWFWSLKRHIATFYCILNDVFTIVFFVWPLQSSRETNVSQQWVIHIIAVQIIVKFILESITATFSETFCKK